MKKEEIGNELFGREVGLDGGRKEGLGLGLLTDDDHQLIRELALEDEPAFARYFRMDKNKFDDLVLLLPVFDLWRLSSITLGTYPTTQVSSHRTVRVFAFRHHLIELQV